MLSVEFNSKTSCEFRRALEDAVQSMPYYAAPLLSAHGYRIVAGAKLPDLHPRLEDKEMHSGFHAPTIKTIFLAETYHCQYSHEWIRKTNVAPSLFHETGHGLDFVAVGTGIFPDGYFSSTAFFEDAFNQDKAALERTSYSKFYEVYGDWYNDNGGVEHLFRHFHKAVFTPKEIYAEVWAQICGMSSSMPMGLPDVMPSCAVIAREHHEKRFPHLAEQHDLAR